MLRRQFLAVSATPFIYAGKAMSSKERVDAVLAGKQPDRSPISLWHHFGLEKQGPEAHAAATLKFHADYNTDLVKVMSDFPYPKPAGKWYEPKVEASPFAPQLKALEIINGGIKGSAHFVETIFNPWNVAEKLSTPAEVQKMKREQPQKLLDALEVIAKSEANHAKLALQKGASGIFLAIANAQTGILTPEEFKKFSEPFDRMILAAAKDAPLNILQIHGDKAYVEYFTKGWPGAINYGSQETGVSIAKVRAAFKGTLLGGVDERSYRTQSVDSLKSQVATARREAGTKLIVTPGCSVPNDSKPDELKRLVAAV